MGGCARLAAGNAVILSTVTENRVHTRPQNLVVGLARATIPSHVDAKPRVFRRKPMSRRQLFVERRSGGDYAVRRSGSRRASDVRRTQAAAIERAKELNPGGKPVVARVRRTDGGVPDRWRSA